MTLHYSNMYHAPTALQAHDHADSAGSSNIEQAARCPLNRPLEVLSLRSDSPAVMTCTQQATSTATKAHIRSAAICWAECAPSCLRSMPAVPACSGKALLLCSWAPSTEPREPSRILAAWDLTPSIASWPCSTIQHAQAQLQTCISSISYIAAAGATSCECMQHCSNTPSLPAACAPALGVPPAVSTVSLTARVWLETCAQQRKQHSCQ